MLAEFVYGYGNNYAGINISNLDVSLHALQRYAPSAKVILLVDKVERPHVSKLEALFEIDAILTLPVTASKMKSTLYGLYI